MTLSVKHACTVLCCTFAGMALPATAQTINGTINGTINATMTLTAACAVDSTPSSGSYNFGTLDFGTHSTLFDTADGAMVTGASGIEVTCTPETEASLTIVSSQNTPITGGSRALVANGQSIPYDLFETGAGVGTALANNAEIPVTADGTPHTIKLYGRAYGVTGLKVGTYTDLITVSLGF